MDIAGAVREVFRAANTLMDRFWGGQTSAQARLIQDAEEAKAKKWEALSRLQTAQEQGNAADIEMYRAACNEWAARLQQLLDEARDTYGR